MSPDPYETLGVGRDAGSDEIRRAWRRKAKDLHPDTSGCTDGAEFRDVREAYETLAGGEESATRVEVDRPPHRSEPPRRASPPRRAASLRRHLDLVLDPDEAARGGDLPVEIPVALRCPWCGGRSPAVLFCPACFGSGEVQEAVGVTLRIPPRIRDGCTLVFSAAWAELPEIDLVVTVSVEPY